MEGGYFPFFTENRPQNHKKHAILHTSQTNGGLEPPPAPPGYATDYIYYSLLHIHVVQPSSFGVNTCGAVVDKR